jgi:hypothetical protein
LSILLLLDAPQVVVDSCSHHMSCHVILERRRHWVLVADRPDPPAGAGGTGEAAVARTVGVEAGEIAAANATLLMRPEARGWGLPSSVLRLLRVTHASAPHEWRPAAPVEDRRPARPGARRRVWQLRSVYRLTATDMEGACACARVGETED